MGLFSLWTKHFLFCRLTLETSFALKLKKWIWRKYFFRSFGAPTDNTLKKKFACHLSSSDKWLLKLYHFVHNLIGICTFPDQMGMEGEGGILFWAFYITVDVCKVCCCLFAFCCIDFLREKMQATQLYGVWPYHCFYLIACFGR